MHSLRDIHAAAFILPLMFLWFYHMRCVMMFRSNTYKSEVQKQHSWSGCGAKYRQLHFLDTEVYCDSDLTSEFDTWCGAAVSSYLNKDADRKAPYVFQRSDSLHCYSAVICQLIRHIHRLHKIDNCDTQNNVTRTDALNSKPARTLS
jgi:hypothetical protein